MLYFNSDDIKVYPAANRDPKKDFGATLNLEQNIIKASNNITDYNDYIISGFELSIDNGSLKIDPKSGETYSRCVIKGYTIDIDSYTYDLSNLDTSTEPDIYLCMKKLESVTIRKRENNTDITVGEVIQLNGQDSNDVYTGIFLIIGTTPPNTAVSGDVESFIKLGTLKYENNVWAVSATSWTPKININNTKINANQLDSSISSTQEAMKFEDWFENYFIIDDGQLS